MSIEKTLGIIKPDGVAKNVIGQILSRVEKSGLKIIAARMEHLNQQKAEGFYAVHKERPFYASLVQYMTSGPVLVFCMEGEGAISKWRELMGATDPAKAAAGTIRQDFATNIEQNSVHGSDATETARTEISYFFGEDQVFSR